MPVPAKFDDVKAVKEEHAARLKSYSIQQESWVQRSARYQYIRNAYDLQLMRICLGHTLRRLYKKIVSLCRAWFEGFKLNSLLVMIYQLIEQGKNTAVFLILGNMDVGIEA